MEYACKVAGSRIVVVLGHTKCGAVNAACHNVELGNITTLLGKVKPAVDIVRQSEEEMDDDAIEKVAIQNVKVSIERIRNESPVLAEQEIAREIEIVGALYDVCSGQVDFFEE